MPKTILLVTDRCLFPMDSGSSVRVVNLIRGLKRLGHTVVLVVRRRYRDRAASYLADDVFFVDGDPWRERSFDAFHLRHRLVN